MLKLTRRLTAVLLAVTLAMNPASLLAGEASTAQEPAEEDQAEDDIFDDPAVPENADPEAEGQDVCSVKVLLPDGDGTAVIICGANETVIRTEGEDVFVNGAKTDTKVLEAYGEDTEDPAAAMTGLPTEVHESKDGEEDFFDDTGISTGAVQETDETADTAPEAYILCDLPVKMGEKAGISLQSGYGIREVNINGAAPEGFEEDALSYEGTFVVEGDTVVTVSFGRPSVDKEGADAPIEEADAPIEDVAADGDTEEAAIAEEGDKAEDALGNANEEDTEEELLEEDEFEEEIPTLNTASVYYLKNGFQSEYTVTSKPQYSYKGTGYNFAANSNNPHYTSLIIATNTLRGTSTKFICVEPSLYGYVENSKFYADDEVLTDETLIKILYYGALGYAGTNHALQYAGNSYAGSVVLTHVSAARRIYQLNRGREHGNADYAFGAANGSQVWKYGGNTALENATTNYINHVKSLAMPTGVTVLITNGIYKSTGNWVQKYVAIIKDGYLVIQKKSANTSVTNGNSLYNFSGIKYGIYADSGCTKLVKEVSLSADGKSPSVELLPGNYWIKETEGNNYYKKSGTVTKVTVSESSTKTQSVSDQPNLDLEPFTITKQVYDKNGGQLTGFDLSGFQFTIEYYDKWINYNGSNVSGTPVRKWIVQTDPSGVAKLDSDHLVSGSSALYKDADGNVGLPVGHLRVTETKIPAKYEGMMEHSGKWGIRYKDRSDDSWKNGTYSIASDGSINYHLTHFDYYTGDSGYNTHLYGRVDGSNDNVQVSEIRNTAQNVITYDTGTLTVRKRDKEAASAGMATGTIQGTAQNFQGAMYDVINNTGGTVIYKGTTYQNGAVVASFTTNADGWARVSGLQTGAYILRETSAIEGYQLAPDKDVTIEADVDNSYMGNGNGLLEEPKRNDFILKKTDTSGKAMANVLFRIEDSNGNAQEFSTGDDGTFSSAGSDVWFGVTGKIAGKGALLYGTYTVTELSCDANEGVESLADPVTFTVGDGSPAVIDLGTVRNQLAPVIDTLLTDEDGAHSGNPEDPMSLTDTVTLSHLEEYIGKTLTIKGSLYDKTTGNVVATAQETAAVTAGNAASMEKTVTFSFDGTLIAGHALVAVEELYDGGTLVAEHRDMADADQTYTVNPNEPLVATVLTDSASAHTGDVGASVTLTDKVTLYNFQSYIGQTITVKGKLVRKDTGATIKEATKTIAITAENAAKASVSVTFTFDSSALAGKSLVAYEYAMSGQTEIAKHEEASDAQQTYTFKFKTPVMATVLQDGSGAHHGPVGADVSLTDKVTIKDLEEYIGKTVTIKGKLIDKATGNTVASKQGTVIVTEANAAQLSSNIVFTFDASSYAGRTLVAYETASVGTKEIAKHEDANDTGQSYTFDYKTPSMETVLTNASGAHSGNTGSSVKLTDKVILYDLEEYIGQTITINGSLMDGTTAVATKNAALAVTADNAKEAEVSMTFTVNASRLAGKTIVAYEKAVIGTKTIASHEDPSDADQSYTFNYNTPSVTTVLTDAASSHTGDAGGTITLTDKVTMKNLERYIGKTLTIKGVLMDVTTGESVLEATKSHAVTQANAYSSSESMTFEVASDALVGHVLVAYEYLLDGTSQVAKHEDMADEDQTYTFNYKTPVIATVLHDRDDDHAGAPSGTVTLTDTVSLKNFEEYIGKTAQIQGELRDKETGDLVEEAQESVLITAANASSLTKDVSFTIDGTEHIGRNLVAYEYVYVDDQKITEHADSNDADQTYTFNFIPPSVDTILRDEDENHAGSTAESVVLNDSVELIHFEQYKGKTAVINGRLIDKATGTELANASKQHAITDSNCSDSVEILSFTIDASALAGKSVVAYETVTINGSVVARHEDPEDADQTYTFSYNTWPQLDISKKAPDGTSLPGAVLQLIDKESGQVVDEWTTDTSAHTYRFNEDSAVQIPYGESRTFIIREKTAPAGYEKADDIEVTVSHTSATVSVDMTDPYKAHDVAISKTDINGQEIDGARLRITGRETGASQDIEPISWTSEAGSNKTVQLKPGSYVLHEDAVPDSGAYVLASDIAFTVDADGSVKVAGQDVDKVTMIDDYAPVRLTVDKEMMLSYKDFTSHFRLSLWTMEGSQRQPLAGYQIEGTEYVTDGDGCVEFQIDTPPVTGGDFSCHASETFTLPRGIQYRVEELPTEDPNVNVFGTSNFQDTLSSDRTAGFRNIMNNYIEFEKVDQDGVYMPGAVMQILDDQGNVVKEWTTAEQTERIYLRASVTSLGGPQYYVLHEKTKPGNAVNTAADIRFMVIPDTQEKGQLLTADGNIFKPVEKLSVCNIDRTKTHSLTISKEYDDNGTGVVLADDIEFAFHVLIKNLPVEYMQAGLDVEEAYIGEFSQLLPLPESTGGFYEVTSNYRPVQKTDHVAGWDGTIRHNFDYEEGGQTAYASFVIWIKPGESVTIKDLPEGAAWEIFEIGSNKTSVELFDVRYEPASGTINGADAATTVTNVQKTIDFKLKKDIYGYDDGTVFYVEFRSDDNAGGGSYKELNQTFIGSDGQERAFFHEDGQFRALIPFRPEDGEMVIKLPVRVHWFINERAPARGADMDDYTYEDLVDLVFHNNSILENPVLYTCTGQSSKGITDYAAVTALLTSGTNRTQDFYAHYQNRSAVVAFEKKDSEGAYLPGAHMAVIDKETEEIVEEWVTDSGKPHTWNISGYVDSDGYKTFEGKQFILRELDAPEGYQKADDIEFTLKAHVDTTTSWSQAFEDSPVDVEYFYPYMDTGDGQEKLLLTMVDEVSDWGFTIKKVSSEDGAALDGARFAIYSQDAEDLSAEVDADAPARTAYEGSTWYLKEVRETANGGLAAFAGLTGDRYLLKEVKAPAGYYAGDDSTRIVTRDEDKGQTIEIQNIPGSELPVTGGHGSWYVYMLSAMFIMAAVLLARRKKA